MKIARVTVAVVVLAALSAGTYIVLQRARAPKPQHVTLPDGTTALFYSDSKLMPAAGFPHPRMLAVDGDLFIRAPATGTPMTITSRLLRLSIPGACELRITGYSHQSGEQV